MHVHLQSQYYKPIRHSPRCPLPRCQPGTKHIFVRSQEKSRKIRKQIDRHGQCKRNQRLTRLMLTHSRSVNTPDADTFT